MKELRAGRKRTSTAAAAAESVGRTHHQWPAVRRVIDAVQETDKDNIAICARLLQCSRSVRIMSQRRRKRARHCCKLNQLSALLIPVSLLGAVTRVMAGKRTRYL